MCGSLDVRDIHKAIAEGDPQARLALDTFTHRLRHYTCGYAGQLGKVDAIAFTAGIGENDPITRRETFRNLEAFGIQIDESRNTSVPHGEAGLISPDGAPVQVWVVPTNEEFEIAHQSADLIAEMEANEAALAS
jgi:acetate kinase